MTIHRCIRNKERCAYRGPKERYAVLRARMNEDWERINQARCETICKDNDLNIEDFKSSEDRNSWEHTRRDLEALGYFNYSKSWRDHYCEDKKNQLKLKAEEARDYIL